MSGFTASWPGLEALISTRSFAESHPALHGTISGRLAGTLGGETAGVRDYLTDIGT